MKTKIFLPFIIGLLTFSFHSKAQNSRAIYIQKYKNWAIKEMKRTGIPASITLAQGMLESANGQSMLAKQAKNHFGIKCHSSWNGPYVRKDDDKRNECFRKYNSVYESYKDHSDFLTSGKRYAFLFDLKPTDYKRWAKGLKKAGYATSRTYAKRLIKIIEENQLYRFDTASEEELVAENIPATTEKEDKKQTKESAPQFYQGVKIKLGRDVKQNNHVNYIIARRNDNYSELAKEFEMMRWEIYRYNDAQKGDDLHEGDIVYLKPKRRKADRNHPTHLVKTGDTWRSIAQKYGIKMKKLKKRNAKKHINDLKVGETIYLR